MKLQGDKKLILTIEEETILYNASEVLNEIATLMDRAISVDWSDYSDEDIWGACEIIDSFVNPD